jgi:hypothetical protein
VAVSGAEAVSLVAAVLQVDGEVNIEKYIPATIITEPEMAESVYIIITQAFLTRKFSWARH